MRPVAEQGDGGKFECSEAQARNVECRIMDSNDMR